jgi:pyruvate dehydrogenase E2 component (dihydrolipoamide acetyltransferase)
VAIEVTMPQMGADMTEGTVVRWIKQVGEEVRRGDVIAEIETDKATVELEAFDSGVLRKHVVPEGETVPVGQVIALLGTADEPIEGEPERKPRPAVASRRVEQAEASRDGGAGVPERAQSREAGEAEKLPEAVAGPAEPEPAPAHHAIRDGRLRISPVARRLAQEAGLDLAALRGSGPDGRILRKDVEAAVETRRGGAPPAAIPTTAGPPPAPAPAAAARPAAAGTLEPRSRIRQTIARRMAQSKQQAPHYYITVDIDMTEAMAFRERLNVLATAEQRVTVNDLLVRACAIALKRHPRFNSEFREDGILVHDQVNIDIGIALDEGLIAPAILDCASKSLGRIAEEAKDLIERAKNGRLRADEYSAGTFTITNLGAWGVETLVGIINPPQAAILGVGSVMPAAVVRDGEVVVRQVMKAALSADHRVTDGAEGARFIKEIQGLLENPVSLAL